LMKQSQPQRNVTGQRGMMQQLVVWGGIPDRSTCSEASRPLCHSISVFWVQGRTPLQRGTFYWARVSHLLDRKARGRLEEQF
jgi:hypothetical protein